MVVTDFGRATAHHVSPAAWLVSSDIYDHRGGVIASPVPHLATPQGRSLNSLMSLTNLKALDVRCCELLSAVDVTAFRLARPNVTVTELRTW